MWSLAQWLPTVVPKQANSVLFHRIQDLAVHVMQVTVADHPLPLWCLTLPALSTGLGKHHIVIIAERSSGVLVIPAIP